VTSSVPEVILLNLVFNGNLSGIVVHN